RGLTQPRSSIAGRAPAYPLRIHCMMRPGASGASLCTVHRARGSTSSSRSARRLGSGTSTSGEERAGLRPPVKLNVRRIGRRSAVDDDAPLDLALQHQVERAVQLAERQAPADQLVELVLSAHVEIDQHRYVGALIAAAERAPGEDALLQEQ